MNEVRGIDEENDALTRLRFFEARLKLLFLKLFLLFDFVLVKRFSRYRPDFSTLHSETLEKDSNLRSASVYPGQILDLLSSFR